MHIIFFVICALSLLVKAVDVNDIPPVEVIQDPSGAEVFCLMAHSRWAKPSYIHEYFPSATRVGIARLPNHRLDFNDYSEVGKGSVSTAVPDCGYEVWGAIYYIPIQDFDTVLSKGGILNNKRVFHLVQDTVEAYFYGTITPVYMKCNSFRQIELPEKLIYGLPLPEDRRPSKQILDVMVEAFQDAGLPSKYIEEISKLPVRGQCV